jgi:hypothetical protein
MDTETTAAILGSVVGGAISLATTVWFQVVQTRGAEKQKFRTYAMELSLVINSINDNLLTHSALEIEVDQSINDSKGSGAVAPLSHDFSLDQLEASSQLLPSLTREYSLIVPVRSLLSSLRVAKEKVRLAKTAMAAVGVEGSQAKKNLEILKEVLSKGALRTQLESASSAFSDAFLHSHAQLETFNDDHPWWKYLYDRD